MVARDLKTHRRIRGERGLVTQQREGGSGVAVDRQDRIADMERRPDQRGAVVIDIAAQAGDDQAGAASATGAKVAPYSVEGRCGPA